MNNKYMNIYFDTVCFGLYTVIYFFVMPGWWNWYTRTTQNRVPQGMRVRLSLRAPLTL